MKVTRDFRLSIPATKTRLPSRASITAEGVNKSPTRKDRSNAPANPTDSTRAGRYNAITASAARRAASTPIPPQTTTDSSCSKNANLRPSCSRSTRRQRLMKAATSRSKAATMAILGISIRLKPLDRPPQRAFHRDCLPSQFAFRFSRTGPHFLLSHANRFDGRAGLAPQQAAGDRLVDRPCQVRHKVRQLDFWRRYTGNRAQLIQNLLQRQVLAAEDVTFAAPAFFEPRDVSEGAFANVYQIQSRLHVGREFALQKIDDDPSRRSWLHIQLAYRRRRIHGNNSHPAAACFQRHFFGHELRALVVPNHIRERNRGVFIRGMLVPGESHGGYARRVHHRTNSILAGRIKNGPRTLHIRAIHLIWIAQPQPVIGSHMKNRVAAGHRLLDRCL